MGSSYPMDKFEVYHHEGNEYPCNNIPGCDPNTHPQMWDIYQRNSDGWVFMEPKAEFGGHKYTLVFIHGLHSSVAWSLDQFLPWYTQLVVPKNTRVILPQSPHDAAVTSWDVLKMNSWFEMTPTRDDTNYETLYASVNQDQLNYQADKQIDTFNREKALLGNSENIFWGGFS